MTAIVTGMYVFTGFRDTLMKVEDEDTVTAILASMGGGELECACTISEMAFTIEHEVNRIYDENPASAPGVWEYEVGEELGKWLCARALVAMVPTTEELLVEVRKQTLKFLNLWEGE